MNSVVPRFSFEKGLVVVELGSSHNSALIDRKRKRTCVTALLVSLCSISCSKSGQAMMPPDPTFDKAALLGSIATCTLSRYQAFETAAQTLADATAAHAANRSEATANSAKQAWIAAMEEWQRTEVFRFGPTAVSSDPGGQNFRDEIYAFPLFSRCRIEEQVVNQSYAPSTIGSTLISGRGLGAIEFLLFYSGSDNACTEFSTINAQGTWALLGAETIAQRKADYAASAAAYVLSRARALVAAWDPARGNFRRDFVEAGANGVFSSAQSALNAVSDGMFYVEKEVKDFKLGKPLGLIDCMAASCPEAVESPYANVSTNHIRANLDGFQLLFSGCNGASDLGFDDWLRAAGAGDLADRMAAALANAQTVAAMVEPALEEELSAHRSKVEATHTALKGLTDLLKVEFVSVLNLELPRTSEGDND